MEYYSHERITGPDRDSLRIDFASGCSIEMTAEKAHHLAHDLMDALNQDSQVTGVSYSVTVQPVNKPSGLHLRLLPGGKGK